MINHQFPPLPGEHLYSWLVRLYWLSGFPDVVSFQNSLGLSARNLNPYQLFGSTIIPMANIAAPSNKIKDVMLKNTSIVFWAITAPQLITVNELGFENLFRKHTHMNERVMFNFNRSWSSCSLCRKEDSERFGSSYWHMAHQLPSITHCYKHGVTLDVALEPVINLYTGELPHHVRDWKKNKQEHCSSIDKWSRFIIQVYKRCAENPVFATSLTSRIEQHLALENKNNAKLKRPCVERTEEFEASLGEPILRHLFRSYAKPKESNKVDILYVIFSRQNQSQQVRNPVFWLAVAYWLRNEINII
jgi:hypothetical protein